LLAVVPVPSTEIRVVGRYALHDEIAAGGMATVHIGRLLGPVGFSRTVAIKRLHAQFAKDPEFVSMFLDEARVAARVRHPNVIGTLDVVALAGELFLVMEYVHGETLARLMRVVRDAGQSIPVPIVAAVMIGVLDGLHAAHEATNDRGEPLTLVHRDISPHNILVGTDGISRVLDFGIAKAAGRVQTTRDGQLKGKLSYMAPEQIHGSVDRRTDVYAASVVLWEGLVGKRLFFGENEAKTLANVLSAKPDPPSKHRLSISPELDALVLRGLNPDPTSRFASAREMARALQKIVAAAPASDVGDWVAATAGTTIASRAERVASIERSTLNASDESIRTAISGVETVRPPLHGQAANDGSIIIDDFERAESSPPGPLTKRGRVIAIAVAALLGAASAIAIRASQRSPAAAASAAVTEASVLPLGPTSSLPALVALAPPPPSEPVEASTQPALPSAPAPVRTAAPRLTARPVATPPKRAAEFDHVIDSRK
jgi:serine/threonine protein kinase